MIESIASRDETSAAVSRLTESYEKPTERRCAQNVATKPTYSCSKCHDVQLLQQFGTLMGWHQYSAVRIQLFIAQTYQCHCIAATCFGSLPEIGEAMGETCNAVGKCRQKV